MSLVVSLLHHPALPHHQDVIRVTDGREAVGDDEAGLACHEGFPWRPGSPCSVRVSTLEVASSRISMGLSEAWPGRWSKLPLALGNAGAVVLENCVIALGQGP